MKLVSYCSFKGGAGKTTALMAMASCLIEGGASVALFEADENRPLTRWEENARMSNSWDPNCQIFIADDMQSLEASYNGAVAQKFDYALVDTKGGASEHNNTIIASSDFLVLPTALSALDIDEALATYRYIVELLLAESLNTPSAVLKSRVPVSRLTNAQRQAQEMLNMLPVFPEPMHDRDAFATMKTKGMLHIITKQLSEDPMTRLQARNYQTALQEAKSFTKGILNVLRVSNGNS